MAEYRIEWTIDVDGEDAIDAAVNAFGMQRDPESTATIFRVTPRDEGASASQIIDVCPDPSTNAAPRVVDEGPLRGVAAVHPSRRAYLNFPNGFDGQAVMMMTLSDEDRTRFAKCAKLLTESGMSEGFVPNITGAFLEMKQTEITALFVNGLGVSEETVESWLLAQESYGADASSWIALSPEQTPAALALIDESQRRASNDFGGVRIMANGWFCPTAEVPTDDDGNIRVVSPWFENVIESSAIESADATISVAAGMNR